MGLKSYILEIDTMQNCEVIISTEKEYPNLLANKSFDIVICDDKLLKVESFNLEIEKFKIKNPNSIFICTCQGMQNFDLKTMANANCDAIIDKSMSKSDIEKFLAKMPIKTNNPDFSILFKNYGKEQKIKTRLKKKYKYLNLILKEEMYLYEVENESNLPVNSNTSLINLAI